MRRRIDERRTRIMLKFRSLLPAVLVAFVAVTGFSQAPGQGPGPGRGVAPVQTTPSAAFRATNYQIRASLDAVGRVLSAQAKVDFAANEPSRIVDVELSQTLRVN